MILRILTVLSHIICVSLSLLLLLTDIYPDESSILLFLSLYSFISSISHSVSVNLDSRCYIPSGSDGNIRSVHFQILCDLQHLSIHSAVETDARCVLSFIELSIENDTARLFYHNIYVTILDSGK